MVRQTREHRHEKKDSEDTDFLYGCETWTMTKKTEKRSTHVRCGYRGCKIYHGRWTEKKTNESVRMEIGIEDETLKQTALSRKLGFFGHVMRSD